MSKKEETVDTKAKKKSTSKKKEDEAIPLDALVEDAY